MYKTLLEKTYLRGEQNMVLHAHTPVGELVTIPDQALSPREILTLFQQGRSRELPSFKVAYDNGIDIPDLTRMDKIEMEEFETKLRKKVNDLRETSQKLQKEADQEIAWLTQLRRDQEAQEQKKFDQNLDNK